MRDEHRELNRAWWDERVPIHTASEFYDVEGFRAGAGRLRPFEVEEVGDVAGKRLLHLQCHFGLDSLSWARLEASVVGLDFSQPAVAAANALAAETRLDGTFVAADVYDARAALGGERFEVVYTGLGALNWLSDLGRWAEVVSSLLADDGILYLAEFHPFADVFADEDLTVAYDYFHDPAGLRLEDDGGTYADLEAATASNATHEWAHPISEVVGAVLGAGLRLELFNEHDYTLFPRWPFLLHQPGGYYHQPDGRPKLPLIYSLRARRD
ncbi:MAG: class I SAM-dependent methyltransferase [Vicinamibacteria bacterium]